MIFILKIKIKQNNLIFLQQILLLQNLENLSVNIIIVVIMKTVEYEVKFYKKRIKELESKKVLSNDDLCEAQTMLQFIEYANFKSSKKQTEEMKKIDAFNRLADILKKYNCEKLGDYKKQSSHKQCFDKTEVLLDDFLTNIEKTSHDTKTFCNAPIFNNIASYTKYIENLDCDSVIFLLRDVMLPYFAYNKRGTKKYAFQISRKMMHYFKCHEVQDVYDYKDSDNDYNYLEYVWIIYEASTLFYNNFEKFFNYIKPKFLSLLNKNKPFYDYLKKILSQIQGKKILVVDSGRFGTMPLILKCIDNRVDFVLFTTCPEMYSVYNEKIFTKNTGKLYDFELITSQNDLFTFSSIKNDNTYIKITNDKNIVNKSLEEIKTILEIKENIDNKK